MSLYSRGHCGNRLKTQLCVYQIKIESRGIQIPEHEEEAGSTTEAGYAHACPVIFVLVQSMAGLFLLCALCMSAHQRGLAAEAVVGFLTKGTVCPVY